MFISAIGQKRTKKGSFKYMIADDLEENFKKAQKEIREQTHFHEHYFDSEIVM